MSFISDLDASVQNYGCVVLLIVVLVFVSLGWSWCRAGAQARIYKRQGIEISQWEVFIGTKPAETVIQVRENAKQKDAP